MDNIVCKSMFPDWNPHFTPQWLSEKLVSYLPKQFFGTVVDPACGAGNLLVAAANYLDASKGGSELRFVGIDVSKKAVDACRTSLSSLLPYGNFAVQQADFMATPVITPVGATAVVMNPPFKGYGRLEIRARRHIAASLRMKGRFNLGYAFVQRAVAVYRPAELVTLLPSNWMYSRRSSFRLELDSLSGSWDWEDIGGDVFKGLSVDVGILIWRSKATEVSVVDKIKRESPIAVAGFDVRHGVATGCDSLFIDIAKRQPRFGRVVRAVRGREVGRRSSVRIWIPPAKTKLSVEEFKKQINPEIVAGLEARSCVTTGRRRIFEYHDPLATWFLKGPKLLIPEIVVGALRVELDSSGRKLPLHSVLAIRVPSVAEGRLLRAYLLTPSEQENLLSGAPRLSGGATRLQVGALRDSLARWFRSRSGVRRV